MTTGTRMFMVAFFIIENLIINLINLINNLSIHQ